MSNSVVHFEIPADDRERAQTFYSDAFGWNIQYMPEMEYSALMTTDSDEQGMPTTPGAINGGLAKRSAPMSEQPTITIGVDDIDKALEKGRLGRRLGRRREDPGRRHGLGGLLQGQRRRRPHRALADRLTPRDSSGQGRGHRPPWSDESAVSA